MIQAGYSAAAVDVQRISVPALALCVIRDGIRMRVPSGFTVDGELQIDGELWVDDEY